MGSLRKGSVSAEEVPLHVECLSKEDVRTIISLPMQSIPEIIQTILQHCLLMFQSPTFKSLLTVFGFQVLIKKGQYSAVIVILA